MKCAVHTEVDAAGFCRNCGKALCPACTRDVRGALYCEPCLANMVAPPPVAAAAAHTGPNPGVALALGFIPGLGAVYNGEYIKALIHVFVFAGLIAALTNGGSAGYDVFLGIGLGVFCLYMPIDSYHVAKARQTGAPLPAPFGDVAGAPEGDRKPVGAVILIALGAFFLFANLGLFEWDWFGKLWPLGLIALGAWLLADRFKRSA